MGDLGLPSLPPNYLFSYLLTDVLLGAAQARGGGRAEPGFARR